MALTTHERLVLIFDHVTDALNAEREGHYLEVLAYIADTRDQLALTEEMVVLVQERAEKQKSRMT